LSPDFRDPQSAHGSKTYWELIRAIIVLNLCRVNFLVDHGSQIIEWSYRILGDSITNAVLRPLFFQQFCAGEDFKETTDSLEKHGIQSILDYCAEADSTFTISSTDQQQEQPNQPARTYKYYSEAQCDRHRDNFLACLKAMGDVSPHRDGKGGFMALKVTALGNPQLLERFSPLILRLRKLVASRYVRIYPSVRSLLLSNKQQRNLFVVSESAFCFLRWAF
jgi:proline dehydrogenase